MDYVCYSPLQSVVPEFQVFTHLHFLGCPSPSLLHWPEIIEKLVTGNWYFVLATEYKPNFTVKLTNFICISKYAEKVNF